jgi:hypothetical protein
MAKETKKIGFFKGYFGKLFKFKINEFNWKEWALTVFIVLTIIGAFVPSDVKNSQTTQDKLIENNTSKITDAQGKEFEKFIQLFKQQGLIKKLEIESRTAYVDPSVWAYLDFDTKRKVSFTIASYTAYILKRNTILAYIQDSYSGKKLAKYSEAWGFKVY